MLVAAAAVTALAAPAAAAPVARAAVQAPTTSTVRHPAVPRGMTGADHKLVNGTSGRCLVVSGPADDAPVLQRACADRAEDHWWFEPMGPGWFRIRNLGSDKCLVVRGTADQARAVQYSCLHFTDQQWAIAVDDHGQLRFRNRNSGKCLTVHMNLAPAFQKPCQGLDGQWWYRL